MLRPVFLSFRLPNGRQIDSRCLCLGMVLSSYCLTIPCVFGSQWELPSNSGFSPLLSFEILLRGFCSRIFLAGLIQNQLYLAHIYFTCSSHQSFPRPDPAIRRRFIRFGIDTVCCRATFFSNMLLKFSAVYKAVSFYSRTLPVSAFCCCGDLIFIRPLTNAAPSYIRS